MSFVKGDGQKIKITFDRPIINDVSSATGREYRTIDDAVITALNYSSSSYLPSLLNNGVADTSYFWYGTTAINWLLITFEKAITAYGFRWYVPSASYYPLTFTISGSNDGAAWTQLGGTFTGTSTVGWQEFKFDNTNSHLLYKINILTASSSRIYLSELQLLLDYSNEKAFTVTVPEYTYVPGGVIQDISKTVAKVYSYAGYSKTLDLMDGNLSGIRINNLGALTLEVDNG